MTCIIGIIDKKDNKVIIGGDSCSSSSYNRFIRKDVKVFKNGKFVFGCTSSYRMIQILRYSFSPPSICGMDLHKYMCTKFIDEIRRCFKEGGFIQKNEDGEERGGQFLVGYGNRLFKIDNDFQVAENLNGFDGCGTGSDFALGSLYTIFHYAYPSQQKLLFSLQAAEFLAIGVSKPFIFEST